LEYFMAIWDTLWPFGTFCNNLVHFFPVLVSCIKINLATLPGSRTTNFSLPLT
jgi:hypothetical protein